MIIEIDSNRSPAKLGCVYFLVSFLCFCFGVLLTWLFLSVRQAALAERLRAARHTYPDVPIIAISGQFRAGLDGAGSAAQALGVDRVIAKPFGRKALLDAVRSVIAQPVLGAG